MGSGNMWKLLWSRRQGSNPVDYPKRDNFSNVTHRGDHWFWPNNLEVMGSSLGTSLYSYAKNRLSSIEELARATIKKLTQRMTEHNKAMASAKSDEAKASVKAQNQNTTTGLQTWNNILAMTQLHAKSPSFIGDKRINLSWKEVAKASAPYWCWQGNVLQVPLMS
ncbi:unnamed protein product [Camellia sinensis]